MSGPRPERTDAEVLAARARRLARRPPARDREGEVEIVAFSAGGQGYALEAAQVAGILPVVRVSPLPGGGPAVRGLILARGVFATLFDLPRLLGRTGGEASPNALLLAYPRLTAALGADDAATVLTVSRRELTAAPDDLPSVRAQVLAAGRPLLLLDSDLLLDTYLGLARQGDATP